MSLHEQIELRDFIKRNPEYNSEFEAWEEARLEEDDLFPMYPNAQNLLVAEQTVFQKTWKYAAAIIVLLGTGVTFLMMSGSISTESMADETGTDLIVSPEYGTNSFVTQPLSNTPNTNQSQSNGITPHALQQQEPAVSGSPVNGIAGTEPGSWNDALEELNRIDARMNPIAFRNAGSNGITRIRNKAVEREIRNQRERVKKSMNFFLAKRKRRKLSTNPVAADIVNNDESFRKDSELVKVNRKAEDSKGRRDKRKVHERIFDRQIGLTNLHDPIVIVDGENPVDLNPALVGGVGAPRLNMSYRNQWAGSGNSTIRYGVSYDQQVDQLSGGIGFAMSYMDYEGGMYRGYGASVSYAPKFDLSRDVALTVGAEFSVHQNEVNFENYNYDSQVEMDRGTVYDTYSSGYQPRADKILYKDMAVGMMLNTPYFFVGGSVDHLFEPAQNLYTDDFTKSYNVNRKYSVQVGTDYQKRTGSDFAISPQLIYNNQGGKSELWVSSSVRFKNLIAGTGFSTSNSLKGLVGVQGKHLRLMYGYDLTQSELSGQLQGSHEASLRVLLNNKKRRSPLAFL